MRSKRKRSSSQASSNACDSIMTTTTTTTTTRGNPFLAFVQCQGDKDTTVEALSTPEKELDDEVFPMVVTFLKLTRKRKGKKKEEGVGNDALMEDSTTSLGEAEGEDIRIARRLLETFGDERRNAVDTTTTTDIASQQHRYQRPQMAIVSNEDVASLLVPWAIKRLLRAAAGSSSSSTAELEWGILSKCTDLLLEKQSCSGEDNKSNGNSNDYSATVSSHELSNHFSLSTLHKLVPLAGSVALKGHPAMTVEEDGLTTHCRQMAATCYCSWVQFLYRPTFDIVCGVLLPVVAESARQQLEAAAPVGDEIHPKMTMATLVLLQESLRNANPKRAFQSLAHCHTLSALSDIYSAYPSDGGSNESAPSSSVQSLIQTVVDDGLYHLDHHMDGFRSLQIALPDLGSNSDEKYNGDAMEVDDKVSPFKKSFHCYQESLLNVIKEVFSLWLASKTAEDSGEAASSSPFHSIVRIIPLLLDGFIQQSTAIQHHKSKAKETEGKKKAATNKILQLQFLFFANLTVPMVHSIDRLDPHHQETSIEVLLQSLGQCVHSLLLHDVYLPANDDVNDQNFSYLQALSQILVRYASSNRGDNSGISMRVLPILATTLQLNHLIFHADLSKTISSCLTLCQNGSVPEEAVGLFCAITSTYKRLRQLDYLCSSLVEATSSLRDHNDVSGLQALCRLVENPKVVDEFGEAVRSSPIQQTKQIVSDLNSWIQASIMATTPTGGGNDAQNASVGLVVGVFCLLLKTARIDAASALDLSPLCIQINSSIQSLMGATVSLESVDFLSKCGLQLCGSTIDLKNRCDFWLRNSREEESHVDFRIPDAVSAVLTQAVDDVSHGAEIRGVMAMEELQLLACHRLQQLHANIHEKQRVAFATDADEFGVATDVQETKQVATFALKALQQEKDKISVFNRQWNILVGSIPSWAPYVDDSDIRWFLSCFFNRLCSSRAADHEADSTLWLLRDASFLETQSILKNFGRSGISFVARAVQEVFDGESTKTSLRLHEYACPPEGEEWKSISPSKLDAILEQRLDPTSRREFSGNSWISIPRALRCVQLLNSVPGSIWDCCGDSAGAVLEACLRLDYVCREIARHEGSHQSLAFEMIASLRTLLARVSMEARPFLNIASLAPRVLSVLFHSTTDLMSVDRVPVALRRAVLECTKTAVVPFISHAQSAGTLSKLSLVIKKLYDDGFSIASQQDSLVLISFGLSIVSGLSVVEASSVPDDATSIIEGICGSVWTAAVSLALDMQQTDETSRQTAVLFISEVLRRGSQESMNVQDRLKSIEAPLVDKISQATDGKVSKGVLHCISYLVASFAAANPPKESRQTLFDALTKSGAIFPSIIQDALCHLVLEMESEEMGECLVKLTSTEQSSENLSSRLRLFRLIILNAKSEDQIEVISQSSRLFLSLSFGSMISNGSSADGIRNAVELIEEMASRKQIISIRERDLCLILAHAVGAMRVEEGTVNSEVFDSCFSVISFMLQRFSKQLHNCIPSVISCMSVILEHSLYANLQDLEIIDRGHKFSRLCELLVPHGEVYKKHVLCLVVEFVEALKHNMDPTRRNALSPAIYCLLDILQQHETTQLNSMLDNIGRATLRTVHESYKKQHVYKGQ